MSTPKNHHFVSKIHINGFFNQIEKKIFIYDKKLNNFYNKVTTKSLFSEEYINSRYINGDIDHISLEKELNDFFENDFSKNILIIEEFTVHNNCSEEVMKALLYFAKYGIICEMRTPRHKKGIDDAFFGKLEEILQNAAPDLKSEIEEILEYKKHVKYSNVTSYLKIANQMLELMGEIRFEILIADKENYFFIPDFGAATMRDKINEYFNPDIKEVAYVGLPLTSKIFINFLSVKLYKEKSIPDSVVNHCDAKVVEYYNLANFKYCEDKIACENEVYLKDFVKRNKTYL